MGIVFFYKKELKDKEYENEILFNDGCSCI